MARAISGSIKWFANSLLARAGLRITVDRASAYNGALYESCYPAEALDRRRFYNFGAGNWRHRFWTNVDYASHYYEYDSSLIDIYWDIASLAPVPIESGTAELVYSSHTIEHLLDRHVDHMLGEAHRVLKPAGILRITAPNIRLVYFAYRLNDIHFGVHYGAKSPRKQEDLVIHLVNEMASQLVQAFDGHRPQKTADELRCMFDDEPMEQVLAKLSGMIDFSKQRQVPGHHASWWTNEKLADALRRAGFSQIIVSIAGGSIAPVMRDRRYFDTVLPTCSLFVDAVK